jgi:hypothetical protein
VAERAGGEGDTGSGRSREGESEPGLTDLALASPAVWEMLMASAW